MACLFCCDSILGWVVIQVFDLGKLEKCDITMWAQNDVKYKNMSTVLKFCRVDMQQELHIVMVVMMLP